MIIVLEGPDCSGKTTLAKMLVDNFNFNYFHTNYVKGTDTFEETYKVATACHSSLQNVVLDRYTISEMVYGTVFREECFGYHPAHQPDNVQERFQHLNDYLSPDHTIVCLPPHNIWRSQFKMLIDNQLYKNIQDMEEVYTLYYAIANNPEPIGRCPVAKYDYAAHSPKKLLNDIIKSHTETIQ